MIKSQIALLQKKLSCVFEGTSYCVMTAQGDVIVAESHDGALLGGMVATSKTAIKYLQMSHGKISITNDPFSGGVSLRDFFVTLAVEPQKGICFYITTSISLKPTLESAKVYSAAAVRVPPILISDADFHVQTAILSAIAGGLGSDVNFADRILSAIAPFAHSAPWICATIKDSGFLNYKKADRESAKKILHDEAWQVLEVFPHAAGNHTTRLGNGQQVQVHVENIGSSMKFDFSGTQLADTLSLSSAATVGILLATITRFVGYVGPLHQGFWDCISVRTATQSLDAVFPQSCEQGRLVLPVVIANTLQRAFSKLVPTRAIADHAGPVFVEFRFKNKSALERTQGGTGAEKQSEGELSLENWNPPELHPSWEELEKRFPLRVLRSDVREGSGGRGLQKGGNGTRRVFEVLEDVELHWCQGLPDYKPDGIQGASQADSAKIIIETMDNKSLEGMSGVITLTKGSKVAILAAGGGGFGQTPKE